MNEKAELDLLKSVGLDPAKWGVDVSVHKPMGSHGSEKGSRTGVTVELLNKNNGKSAKRTLRQRMSKTKARQEAAKLLATMVKESRSRSGRVQKSAP
ncbi:MAG: hypothetical protein JKY65_17095 [Planctomycetes bacterium]|nr:hypothetical protein [Planctomycetota bacterium]